MYAIRSYYVEMIKKEVADGVNHIILTPHVQSRVSKFQPKEHVPIFETLVDEVKKLSIISVLSILILGSSAFIYKNITRITSYNVCYTKLLRVPDESTDFLTNNFLHQIDQNMKPVANSGVGEEEFYSSTFDTYNLLV